MATRPMTVRVSEELRESLEEGIRMRRVPGVLFADGPAGRRARIAGTGIEVFEVIQSYLAVDRDWERLKRSYPWLHENPLRAALAYYELYPADVERFLGPADGALDEVYRQHPFMRPNGHDVLSG